MMNTPEVNGKEEKAHFPTWHKQALQETERLVKEGTAKTLYWQQAKQLLRSQVQQQ